MPTTTTFRMGGWCTVTMLALGGATGAALAVDATPTPPPDGLPEYVPVREFRMPAPDAYAPPLVWCVGCAGVPIWPHGGMEKIERGDGLDHCAGPGCPTLLQPLRPSPPPPNPGGGEPHCAGVGCPEFSDLTPPLAPPGGADACMGLNCGRPPLLPPIGSGDGGEEICLGLDCGSPLPGPPAAPVQDPGPPSMCDGVSGPGPGGPNFTPNPVDLVHGYKVEAAADLVVPLPGRDFVLTRAYSSYRTTIGNGLLGEAGVGWGLNVTQTLSVLEPSCGGTVLGLTTPAGSVLYFFGGPTTWTSTGADDQTITIGPAITIDGVPFETYVVTTPGAWTAWYSRHDVGGVVARGRALRVEDVHGHRRDFHWSGGDLMRVALLDASGVSIGDVEFTWVPDGAPGEGRLGQARVIAAGEAAPLQRVTYTYFDPAVHDPAVGRPGDLVQVVTEVRVDRDSDGGLDSPDTPIYFPRYTHYRYHTEYGGDGGPGDADDDGVFGEGGPDHTLKMVIAPAQIEAAARAADTPIDTHAATLLTRPDGGDADDGGGDLRVADLAAKVIAHYSSQTRTVKWQILRHGCGCAGGGGGETRLSYAVVKSGANGAFYDYRSLRIEKAVGSGDDWSPYRTTIYDSRLRLVEVACNGQIIDVPMYQLENAAVSVDADANAWWVTHFDYQRPGFAIQDPYPWAVHTPAATASYAPALNLQTPPTYVAKPDRGAIHTYAYQNDRLTEVRVQSGLAGAPALVRRYVWGAGTPQRPHLLRRVEHVWDESAGEDGRQTTEYDYGFYNGDAIRWIEASHEADRPAENGPGGGLQTYTLYDAGGRPHWMRGPDGVLVHREFDPRCGAVIREVYNAAPTPELDALTEDTPGDWSGRYADGGSLEYMRTYDALGREITRTSPGGITRHTVRELRADPLHPGGVFLTVVQLPPVNEGDPAAPAVVTWSNAAGQIVRMSDFSLASAADGAYAALRDYPFELDQEVARVTHERNAGGQLEAVRRWTRLVEDGFLETAYAYDDLGRVATVTEHHLEVDVDPDRSERTVTRYTWDSADRVIMIEVGTDAEAVGNLATVASYVYDDGDPGNGLLTEARLHPGGGDGDRTTRYIYDGRDRLVKVINDTPPHAFFAYDDLDRMISRSSCVALSDDDRPPSLGDRLSYAEVGYGQRGLAYRERIAIDPSSSSPAFLETHTWRDAMGRVVGRWGPNAAGVKATYDGLGRLVAAFITDRGGDGAPGDPGAYADVHDDGLHASNLDGDRVLEEHHARFITDASDRHVGMIDLVTRWRRVHDAPDDLVGRLSELSGPETVFAIAAYGTSYYDGLNRVVGAVQYGTNHPDGYVAGGAAPSVDQADPPDHATPGAGVTFIVDRVAYDGVGRVDHVVDTAGRRTKFFYDDAYRTIGVAENWHDATLIGWDPADARWSFAGATAAAPDQDRITSTVLRGDGAPWKRIAHAFDAAGQSTDQLTEYLYGAAVGDEAGSLLNADDVLTGVRYPDGSTYAVGANRLGEIIRAADPNGTVHAYTYDALGRLVADEVTDFGPGVDDRIRKITAAFEVGVRQVTIRSHDQFGVANAVTAAFDPLGGLATLHQNHFDDTLNAAGEARPRTRTMWVTMDTQAADGGNRHRPAAVTYPNGATLEFVYGPFEERTSVAVNDIVSRPQGLRFDGADLVGYEYLGVGGAAVVDYVGPDVRLDHSLAHDGGRATGRYPAFDRFGRVVRHTWADGALTTHPTLTGSPDRPPIVELAFSYDAAGNPVSRIDDRPGAATPFDLLLGYDGLDRLIEAERGVWNGVDLTSGPGSRTWSLDALGNWLQTTIDADGDGDAGPDETDIGVFNAANELLEVTRGGDIFGFAYDETGNQTSKTLFDASGARLEFVYDAWNRLVRVDRVLGASNGTIGAYAYNGLMWRTIAQRDASPNDGADALNEQRVLYYDVGWQVVEEHVFEHWSPGVSGGVDRMYQNVWGLRHVDDLVLRRADLTTAPGWDETLYALTDPNSSVTHLIDPSGVVVERVDYGAYGEARHHPFGDVDGDGDRDGVDRSIILAIATTGVRPQIGGVDYRADADLDRDGDVDAIDVAMVSELEVAAALPDGVLSSRGNIFGFCGYVRVETAGLYLVRFRHLDVETGRWLRRDPAGYIDGSNLYAYVGAAPLFSVDPYGLCRAGAGSGSGISRHGRRNQVAPELRRGMIGISARRGMDPLWFGIVIDHPKAVGSPAHPLWTIIILSDDPHHLILDGLGMIPVLGEVADGINGVLYLVEGRPGLAALSLSAMVPIAGNFVTAGKFGARVGRVGSKVTGVLTPPLRHVNHGDDATAGIYVFRAVSGKFYVGQSGDMGRRLADHVRDGRLNAGEEVIRIPIGGGRLEREIAEQRLIDRLGGIDVLDNRRNPIGRNRRHLLNEGSE